MTVPSPRHDGPPRDAEYDVVVVGAGTAGCVVAARLAEAGGCRVALIEAGGEDNIFWTRVPLGSGRLADDPRMTWRYAFQSATGGNVRQQEQPRGKILGGSSSINGMVYIRGDRQDFDEWRALGNIGWSYDDLLPYFRKAEDNVRGADHYHGAGGPMAVSNALPHPIYDAFLQSAEAQGLPLNDDFNGARLEGFGYCQMNIRRGQRSSSSTGYLRDLRQRGRMDVITGAHVQRLLIEGRRAAGVLVRRDGELRTIRAAREVVLCCGAFNTPQLLHLSGIGPGELLQRLGIPIVHAARDVGRKLKDHFSYSMMYRAARPITINDHVNSSWRRYAMGINYLLFRKGWMATNGNSCNGFLKSDPALPAPDVRLNLCMWNRINAGKLQPFSKNLGLAPYSSFHVNLNLLQPQCDGLVELTGPDPDAAPRIQFDFSFPEADAKAALFGIRTTRQLLEGEAMRPFVAREMTPGGEKGSDEELLEFCRRTGGSSMHTVGSCRMGTDGDAVVDWRLRVLGVEGLRIADASIMPTIVRGGTSAATVMIGEKAAVMIIEDLGQRAAA